MASKNRIFVSFAIEDKDIRTLLVGQARNEMCPFEFVDMSVKQPWDEEWKKNCRTRIKGCDGVIVLVSQNTAKASGALWEIQCALEEKIPVIGIYTSKSDRPSSTPSGIRTMDWTWDNISRFINGL